MSRHTPDLDVALVTCVELPEPDADRAPLESALATAGLRARTLAWDDVAAPWSSAKLALLRSCWNYPQHAARFREWLSRTAHVTRLVNSPAIVEWNMHKRYLLDLERGGIPVVPTEVVSRETARPRLAELARRRGFRQIVIKPAISASSWLTQRIGPDRLDAGEAHLRAVLEHGDALVQPYLGGVEAAGELAVVWIEGEVTHAVRKAPRWHGGHEAVSPEPVALGADQLDVARRAVALAPGRPLYARIDLAPGPRGEPLVMELELIEPSLFFRQGPAALERLVCGLRRILAGRDGSGAEGRVIPAES
jgi:hypothetical protein